MTPKHIAAIAARNEATAPLRSYAEGQPLHVSKALNSIANQIDAEVTRLQSALAEAEKRGYDAAKEQAAKWHDGEADYNSGVLQAEESDSVCRGFFADALTFHRDSAKELRAMVRP